MNVNVIALAPEGTTSSRLGSMRLQELAKLVIETGAQFSVVGKEYPDHRPPQYVVEKCPPRIGRATIYYYLGNYSKFIDILGRLPEYAKLSAQDIFIIDGHEDGATLVQVFAQSQEKAAEYRQLLDEFVVLGGYDNN